MQLKFATKNDQLGDGTWKAIRYLNGLLIDRSIYAGRLASISKYVWHRGQGQTGQRTLTLFVTGSITVADTTHLSGLAGLDSTKTRKFVFVSTC